MLELCYAFRESVCITSPGTIPPIPSISKDSSAGIIGSNFSANVSTAPANPCAALTPAPPT